MKWFILSMSIIVLTSACVEFEQGENSYDDPRGIQANSKTVNRSIPESMPNDFNFSLRYGVGAENEINTFEDTFTREGTETIDMALTDDEIEQIYDQMQTIEIRETAHQLHANEEASHCHVESYETIELKIALFGEEHNMDWTTNKCPSNELGELSALVDFVHGDIVEVKEEYQELSAEAD